MAGPSGWFAPNLSLVARQRAVAYLLLAPAVIILLLLAIYPLIYAGVLSFRVDPLYNPNVARFIGWRNFSDLFEDERFWASIRLTLYWAFVVVGAQMILGFFLAVLLDSTVRGIGLLRSLIIIPVFISPIIDHYTGEVPVDSKGRRSYTTGMSYGPSIKKFVVMGYLPKNIAIPGKSLLLEYFNENGDGIYPMTVQIVGKGSLYDPKNERVRS